MFIGASQRGRRAGLFFFPQAASAVSYGVSPRDSLTISSREGGTLWAALQREVVTITGRVRSPPRADSPRRMAASMPSPASIT